MFMVQVNRGDVLDEITHVGVNQEEARAHFLDACKVNLSNFGEYTPDDVSKIINDGYCQFGSGAVVLIDTEEFISDQDIGAMVGSFPPSNVNKIKQWAMSGEIGEVDTIDEVIKRAGECLDSANSWDSCGGVVFRAEDDKWYVLTVNGVITEADPDYLADMLSEVGIKRN